jgi:hypothetical protein
MDDIRAKGGTINDREKFTAEEAETETPIRPPARACRAMPPRS